MIATNELIRLIRTAINEISTQNDTFSEWVDAALVDFIRLAAPLLVMEVPAAYQTIENKMYIKSTDNCFFKRPDGMYGIKIALPDNFCRFTSMRSASWAYPVTHILPDTDPSFQIQYSTVPGIGTGSSSPLVFLSSELDEGILKQSIIAHAIKETEDFILAFVPKPEVSETEVKLDVRLQEALALYAAALYLQSIGDAGGSKAAYDAALNLVKNLNNMSL